MTDACDLPISGSEGEGRLGFGDEGNPTLLERVCLFVSDAVLMVACGRAHQAALTGGGRVFTFWEGAEGRLGHGDTEDPLAPGRVPAAGFNRERVVMVAAGGAHTVALSEEGLVYTWGYGGTGQLGHNNRVDRQLEAARRRHEGIDCVPNVVAKPCGPGRARCWVTRPFPCRHCTEPKGCAGRDTQPTERLQQTVRVSGRIRPTHPHLRSGLMYYMERSTSPGAGMQHLPRPKHATSAAQ